MFRTGSHISSRNDLCGAYKIVRYKAIELPNTSNEEGIHRIEDHHISMRWILKNNDVSLEEHCVSKVTQFSLDGAGNESKEKFFHHTFEFEGYPDALDFTRARICLDLGHKFLIVKKFSLEDDICSGWGILVSRCDFESFYEITSAQCF